MTFVLNKSKAGAEAQDFLKKYIAATQKKFVEKEKELKKEETNLLEKKSIITKEEYKKKTDELRKQVIEYQSQRKSSLDAIAKNNYDNVKIEIYNTDNLEKLYQAIKERGNSKIKICISKEDKNYLFELKNKRKFDYETFKYLNNEQFIKKISL